jgi:hypothetical protein
MLLSAAGPLRSTKTADCGYSTVEIDGTPYLLLEAYGTSDRAMPCKVSGDRRDALQAFLLEPTIAARLDLAQTEALLDEMLAAHAEYLPQFA